MSTTDRQAGRISNSRRVAEEALKSGDDFPEFIETLTPKELGYLGEALACSYLEERGLEVVERQYRCREGEADIIAHDLDSDEIVLVEVKTRRAKYDFIRIEIVRKPLMKESAFGTLALPHAM